MTGTTHSDVDTPWDREPWSNWGGDVVVPHPERVYHPRDLAELVALTRDAASEQPPRRVHAAGSHWSMSDVAVSPDWFVETRALNRTLVDVVPAALSDARREELLAQSADGSAFTYVHVEAGIRVSDLNLRLDRREPGVVEHRLTTDDLLAGTPLAGLRWALPTMGGAGGQTLAGAISTATHGGDHRLPPMTDAVEAVHLVTSGGRQLWIERGSRPLTDPDRLARALPGVVPHRSDDLFDAAVVSLGRMGVVYSLVLRVVQQFSLEQRITRSTWDEQRVQLSAPFPAFDVTSPDATSHGPSVFVEAVLTPYARRDGSRTCFVTHRWRGPDLYRPTRPGRDLFGLVCGQRSVRPVLLVLTGAYAAVTGLATVLAGPSVVGLTTGVVVTGALAGVTVRHGHLTLGEVVAAACNTANRWRLGRLVRTANEWVVGGQRRTGPTRSVAHEIMDLGLVGNHCYKAESVEVAFDASSGAHVAFLTEDLFPLFERSARSGATLGGYVSMRFTRRSSAHLAMQRWDPTCSVEIALLLGVRGNKELLEAAQDAAVARGGTVHWGQRNTLDADQVRQAFPRLAAWEKQLAVVAGDDLTFANNFSTRRGLGPG